ncbi:MAG: STAS/SEC14 domain-containing protein [Sphingomonadales bacterium]|nr:STAS/SEC14 domain-containing protein [Sphingomonadales bacterium]
MLKIETDEAARLLVLTVDGEIHRADYETTVDTVDDMLTRHDKLNVIEIVRAIGWVDFDVWWRDLVFHLTHRNWLDRVAVVSDAGWVGPVTRFFAPLYPAEIRTFSLDDLEEAKQWAKVGDVSRSAT